VDQSETRIKKITIYGVVAVSLFVVLMWIAVSWIEYPSLSGAAAIAAILLPLVIWIAWNVTERAKVASSSMPVSDNASTKETASKKESDWPAAIGFLFILGLLWVAGGVAAAWIWPDSNWSNRWRYSLESDLKDATVTVEPIPHDCEFLTAPLGSKHCHYEKRVLTIRIRANDRASDSGRFVSTDEGKTWQKAGPSDHAAVFISWDKVRD
jgi:hypothetical protein